MPHLVASSMLGWSLAQLLLLALVVLDMNGAGRVLTHAGDGGLAIVVLSFGLGVLLAIASTATALCLTEPVSAPVRRRP